MLLLSVFAVQAFHLSNDDAEWNDGYWRKATEKVTPSQMRNKFAELFTLSPHNKNYH
jgi:hypothetical protein